MPISSHDIENQIIALSDIFFDLKLPSTPLLNEISEGVETGSTKHEWDDDKLIATGCKLASAYTAGAGKITVDDASSIKIDDVLQIDMSLYRATLVNKTTKEVTVSIIDNDEAHSSGESVKFVNNAKKEGAEYQDSDRTAIEKRENFTQIMSDYIFVTGTGEAVNQRHFKSEITRQAQSKLSRLRKLMSRAIIMNVAFNATNNDNARMMGGIRYFLNKFGYVPATTAFSADNLDAFLDKQMNTLGFNPSELWMNPSSHKKFNALHADKINISNGDKSRGEYVDTYLSGTGLKLKLKTDVDIPAGEILSMNTSDMKIIPLQGRSFFAEKLAKTGDAHKMQIVGEYTFEYHNSAQHGIFKHT